MMFHRATEGRHHLGNWPYIDIQLPGVCAVEQVLVYTDGVRDQGESSWFYWLHRCRFAHSDVCGCT